MSVSLKRILAIALVMLMGLNLMTACGSKPAGTSTTPQDSTETLPGETQKSLKVLTLGHSLALDSCHMLALIAPAEGYEDLTVGTLYYSGCTIAQHVDYAKNNARAYWLYVSSTATPHETPAVTKDVTMSDALRFDDWDVIVMQGGPFEVPYDISFTIGTIQILQDFVNENKRNPNAIFAWHMPWALPTDPELSSNSTYASSYQGGFGNDRMKLYQAYTTCVEKHILTDETFQFVIPTATAMENALTSYLTEKDLHRDYIHASDLGRVIAAYVWYCTLTGVQQLEEIKLDTVPKQFFKSIKSPVDWVLTEEEKALILETVNNTLKNPMQITPSQHTQAPAQ